MANPLLTIAKKAHPRRTNLGVPQLSGCVKRIACDASGARGHRFVCQLTHKSQAKELELILPNRPKDTHNLGICHKGLINNIYPRKEKKKSTRVIFLNNGIEAWPKDGAYHGVRDEFCSDKKKSSIGTPRAELTCILPQVHSRRHRTCSGPRVSCQRSVQDPAFGTLVSWRIIWGGVSVKLLYACFLTSTPRRSSCHRHRSSPRGHERPGRGGHDHLAA